MRRALILAAALLAAPAAGEVVIDPPAPGSVTPAAARAAWDRIYDVVSHPRCANCHTGLSDRPMWSGPSYGETRPHGMNIRAGASRIGLESVTCGACHGRTNAAVPHGPPGADAAWRLAPIEADWFGRSSEEICTQLRDPQMNGDRDYLELAGHLEHDEILHWAWAPGPGRVPAPYSLQAHVNDILAWGVAGMPCPE